MGLGAGLLHVPVSIMWDSLVYFVACLLKDDEMFSRCELTKSDDTKQRLSIETFESPFSVIRFLPYFVIERDSGDVMILEYWAMMICMVSP